MIDYLPVFVSILLVILNLSVFSTLADSRGRKSATRFGFAAVTIALLILIVVAILSGEKFRAVLIEWSVPFVLFVLFAFSALGTPGLRRKDTRRRRL